MTRKLFSSVCLITLIGVTSPAAHAGVLMQGFYRDAKAPDNSAWWDHLARKSNELRRAGFTAIWIPPVLKGASGGFSAGYDPFDDYDIGGKDEQSTVPTHWGNREQLQRAVAVMRANGLDVYVDMVLNHRNGDPGNKEFLYRDAFGTTGKGRFGKDFHDFHRDDMQDQDANVPDEDSSFGRDLKHDVPHVANGLKDAGDWLTKALDVQGYRLDYVKGISTTFLRDYLNSQSMAGKFAVGEFKESKRDVVNNWIQNSMQNRSSAFDFGLRDTLKDMCDGHGFFDMRQLDHAGLTGINPLGSVTFVESHDTDEKPFERIVDNKHLAYAYILTSEGYPTVFYRDYFDFGMKATIDNLVWIHEKIANGSTVQRFKDDDVFAYERLGGAHLLAAINDHGNVARTVRVATDFGANVQLHDYTGHAGDVFTDGQGQVTITIPKNNYVAYSRTGISGEFHAPQFAVTQEFAGAKDLDIKPADNTAQVQVGRIFATAQNEIHGELYFDANHWTSATRIELVLKDPDNGQVAAISPTAADHEFGLLKFVPTKTGWHTFLIRSFATPMENDKPKYFLKVRYTAPQTL